MMNGTELFERIKQVSTFDELLQSINEKTKSETQSKRGNVFEKVCDIIIKFGFYSILSNDIYDHYEGNINTCKLKKIENLEIYLQKMSVFSKGKGGSSDITLQNKINGKWVFMSSKFYLDDSKKSIDNYDVEKILAIVKEHSHKYNECDIYLIVNNKAKILNVIHSSKSTNDYIRKNIHKILDLKELRFCFQNLKQSIQDVNINEINFKYCNSKIPLLLRFHQDLITYKQMERINKGETQLLLGAKARSGKTYCVGGLFIKYYKKYSSLNGLIITPAPTETLSQFTDDLFHKFKDFTKINIVEIKKGSDFKSMILTKTNIIIVSKQLLDDFVFDKKVKSIQKLNLDFIVFDENHFHGTTTMSKNILESYSSKKTIKLYLTATFSKPLNEWNIPIESQFYWNIEDEQLCKQRNIQGLIDIHGENVLLFLNEINKENLLSIYDKMPDLHIISNMMDKERYDVIKEKIKDTSYGFSNGTLLCGNYPGEVSTILRYISGSNKEVDYPDGDLSIFGRIKQTSIDNNSRTLLNNEDFTSQIWFLPFGINMKIDKVSEHMKDRMMEDKILKTYEIKIVNSKENYKLDDIKEEIKNWELKAKKNGKTGLILLAGNQLTLGITLPFVDIVFLFNDITSSDRIYQTMYRSMTESINNSENDKINKKNKTIGFVIDMNTSRILNTCLDYKIHNKTLNIEQHITYLVKNNLINIDSDLFKGNENKNKLIEKLLNIWKSDPKQSLKNLMKKIENIIIDMDTKDQQKLNNYFTHSINDNEKFNLGVKVNEESEDALATGKKITKIIKLDGSEDNLQEPDEIEEPDKFENISFTKDVFPFIMYLICILTMNEENKDLLEMLNIIKNNPDLLEVFNDQSFIWWSKNDTIDFIRFLVKKYIKKDSDIYNLSMQFKNNLQSLIDRPKELLEFIDSCLKPKDIEKKQNGEVFTPPTLINEKLDKLPLEVWNNPYLKWLDFSSGMGNYPIMVYLRLMKTLTCIENIDERKKHILENMLYMVELNKKNVFICKQIFDINNKYKLNLYNGDSLKADYNKIFGIDKFDIILGNPPYNDNSGNKGRGHTLWTKFVDLALDILLKENGYLVFIHPSLWRQIEHPLLNKIKGRQILYLEIHNTDDGQKTFRCATRYDWYILHNIKYYQKTIIKDEENIINEIDLQKWNFIPNMMFNEIQKLISNNNNDKLNVNYYRSNYGTEKKIISKIKNNEFKFPVVYSINKKNELSLRYSNTDKNGHFNLSKFIFSNGAGFYCDVKGEYGLTEWAYCIYDKPKILPIIEEVFKSKKFNKIKNALLLDSKTYNIKVMKLFKKNFYKEFNDETQINDKTQINDESKLITSLENLTLQDNYEIIKDGRIKCYLINSKLYKIKRDKTIGVLYGTYENNIIIKT